jgi:hypothetical protein
VLRIVRVAVREAVLRGAAVLGAAVLVAGCSDPASPSKAADQPAPPPSSPTAVATPTIPPPAPAPPRAACYRLTSRELTRPTSSSPTVPCSGSHTSRTIHVGRLLTEVRGRRVAVDSAVVQRQLATACPRRLASYVGGSAQARHLSRLDVVWFTPTLRQTVDGAHWFRCDVIAFAKGDALLPLPPGSGLRGVLGRQRGLDTYGLCGTAAPGTGGFQRVVCSRPHAWRAIRTLDLAGGRRYPGAASVRRAGEDACKNAARSRAADSLKFSYGWEWPTATQWAAGQHYGYCWVPSS